MNTMPGYPVVQIAYFVNDIEAAALRMAQTFGAGPFYISRNIELSRAEHRGESCLFVHSSAYGQWGEVMMELVQQDSPGPSPFRDLYTPGEEGLHHVATMVDSLPRACDEYAAAGIPVATRCVTKTGINFAFLDALRSLGHFIEVYERSSPLIDFYRFIKTAAHNWQGEEPVRTMSLSGSTTGQSS